MGKKSKSKAKKKAAPSASGSKPSGPASVSANALPSVAGRTTCVSSLSISELKAELRSYGISTENFLDKESLMEAVTAARSSDQQQGRMRKDDDPHNLFGPCPICHMAMPPFWEELSNRVMNFCCCTPFCLKCVNKLQHRLLDCPLCGVKLPLSDEEREAMLKKNAEGKGQAWAQWFLGVANCDDYVFVARPNANYGLRLLKLSAEQQFPPALRRLSWYHRHSCRGTHGRTFGLPKSLRTAKDLLERAGNLGDASALYELASIAFKDEGNVKEAEALLKRASEMGHKEATYTLGYDYYYGENGFGKSLPKAEYYLEKAAKEHGDLRARGHLGFLSRDLGDDRSYVEHSKVVADAGCARTNHMLGTFYRHGYRGVECSPSTAKKYFLQAANYEGNPTQVLYYQAMASREDGDWNKYEETLEIIAKRGHIDAQYLLAKYLVSTDHNNRVSWALDSSAAPDFTKGMRWLRNAASNGHGRAKELLKEVEELLHAAGLNCFIQREDKRSCSECRVVCCECRFDDMEDRANHHNKRYLYLTAKAYRDERCGYCMRSVPNGPETKRCGGCKAIRYCDTVCQGRDWRTHRDCCSIMKKQREDRIARWFGMFYYGR